MKVEGFIAGRLRFKGRMAVAAIAISFFVIIVAVAISSGFSREIHRAVAAATGDVTVCNSPSDLYLDGNPVEDWTSVAATLESLGGVSSVEPVVYRAGVIRCGDDIYGALFKGTTGDTASMHVSIPSGLASQAGIAEGDRITAYFISDRMKARRFTAAHIYSNPVDTGDNFLVYVPLADMQRLNGWEEDEVSALEIMLDGRFRSRGEIKEAAALCGLATGLAATAAVDTHSALFDWLGLIDNNVYAILLLMTLVAGFNMISGLLILLFRNISTIGLLKTMGMTSRSIAGVFMRTGARIAAKGMLAGNVLALLFCLVQGTTKFIKLNPENYFVSWVPVAVNPFGVIAADAVCFAVILLLMALPSMLISKIDPSVTVSTQ